MQPVYVALITLAGILFGALITGLYTLRSKRNEYVNDYYKMVIQRRMTAYENLEALIAYLRIAVVDKDNLPYHRAFAAENPWENVFRRLLDVMSEGLWLSNEAFATVRELNHLFFRMSVSEGNAVELAKRNHQTIANAREAIEKALAADMLELHEVKRFLRRKKTDTSGFVATALYPVAPNNEVQKHPK